MHSNTPLYLRVKTNHTHTSLTSPIFDRTGVMENERRLNLEHQPKCSAPGTKPRTVRIRAWANWLDQSVHAKRESATTTQPTGRFVRRATFASALIYFRMQRLMRPSAGPPHWPRLLSMSSSHRSVAITRWCYIPGGIWV